MGHQHPLPSAAARSRDTVVGTFARGKGLSSALVSSCMGCLGLWWSRLQDERELQGKEREKRKEEGQTEKMDGKADVVFAGWMRGNAWGNSSFALSLPCSSQVTSVST